MRALSGVAPRPLRQFEACNGCGYPATTKSVYRVRRLVATELDGSQHHRSNLTDTSSVIQTVVDCPVLGNNGYDR